MGVPRRLSELIGGDFLPATGALQVHFETARQYVDRSRAWMAPADHSRIDIGLFKP
jgi:hypothetical protein